MIEREDLWTLRLRRLPAPSTMQDWARSVDLYLKEKAALDRQRALPTQQADLQTSAPEDR